MHNLSFKLNKCKIQTFPFCLNLQQIKYKSNENVEQYTFFASYTVKINDEKLFE